MQIKISHKLLSINVCTVFVLTSIFIGFSYFSSDTLFSDSLNGIDTEVMEALSGPLSEHYKKHNSWEQYIQNTSLWEETINNGFFTTFFTILEKHKAKKSDFQEPKKKSTSTTPLPKWEFSFGTFFQRAALLDKNKAVLVESEIASEKVSFQAIKLNGEIVGWLRVGKINVDMFPLADYFFKQQLAIGTWASIISAFITIILSYYLSRHITTPISRLTYGAQKIAQRNFNTTITVNTNDELKILADSFNTISKELKRYETQQKQWLMDISHELRTPLTILLCEISSIHKNITHFDISAIESLQEEIQQIKRLVDDLEDLSKIDKIDFSLKNETIDLEQLIFHYSERYKAKLMQKGVELHNESAPAPIYITGDSDRINQVLINLFENSMRYTSTPGKLLIQSQISEGMAILTLKDSGPGVPTESIDKLFDRLFRVDSSRSRFTGGAGLGLTICKKIVEAHKGSIEAFNNNIGGLSIQICLPIKKRLSL